MLGALVLFGAGSAACATAPSAAAFIGARLVLGLAGAGVIVMALSALTMLFSKEERPSRVVETALEGEMSEAGNRAKQRRFWCRVVDFAARGSSYCDDLL